LGCSPALARLALVFRPVRTAISVVVLAAMLWASFAVKLGDKTFAEHVDTISETPEAKQLIDDTRSTINPALVEVRDRLLGEYVEAPTWIPDQPASTDRGEASAVSEPIGADAGARSGDEPSLPGQRRSSQDPGEPSLPGRRAASLADPRQFASGLEPALPGRR
jgi:hypothetical protein